MSQFVPEALRKAAEIYEQRNALYGDNYKRFGPVMKLLFPDGLTIKYDDDWNRIGILVQMVSKLTRYAQNFKAGGHEDSLDDLAVYTMMLRELDEDFKADPPEVLKMWHDEQKVYEKGCEKDLAERYLNKHTIKIERQDGVVVYGQVSKEDAEKLMTPAESAWAYDIETFGYEGTG